jgi:hypothetical protein
MLNVIACLATLHKRISNCRVILDGLESDLRTVRLDLVLTLIKFKDTKSLNSGTIDWRKILADAGCRKIYNDVALEATTVDMDYKEFNEAIRHIGTKTALSLKERCKGWYMFSRNNLLLIIEEKNQLVHTLRQRDHSMEVADLLKCSLKRVLKQVKDMILLAKWRWYGHVCSHIHDMRMNPRVAWEYILILRGSEAAHHKKSVNMAMCLPDGSLAASSTKNMSVLGPHFKRVFSNHCLVDFSVLDLIPQQEQLTEIDHPITFTEVYKAINKLKSENAPGLNGIPLEEYKAMGKSMQLQIDCYVG